MSHTPNAAPEPLPQAAQLKRTGSDQFPIALLRAFLTHSRDVFVALDERGIIRFVSPGLNDQGDFTRQQLDGADAFALVHSEEVSRARSMFAVLQRNPGRPLRADLRIRDATDTYRWIQVSGVSLLQDPEIRAVIVSCRDVTASRQSEESLRSANERLQATLASMTEAYFALDRDWRFIEMNWMAEQTLFQRPPEELLGRSIWELFPGSVDSEFHRQYQLAMTENRPVHFEAPSLIARRWYEVHAYPRGNRLEVYARDIHDRKLVELELRKARDILEQRVTERTAELSREIALRTEAETTMRESLREVQDLYDHAPCGYHSLDDTGRYLRVNDTELAMLGYERSAVIGRPFVDFVVLESKPIFERAFQTLLQRGTVNDVELQMARRDGASFTISFNAIAKYDAAGRFQICRGSGVDITERKRAEERARQLQQDLANIGRLILVGELAAGLAHELNQPLTAVANYARGCARMIRAGNVTPDQLLRGVEQAAEQAERAAEVIRRLRAFFTRRTLHYAATNLNDLVREAVGLLDHDIRQAEVRLQLDLDPRLPAVSVDSIAIVQVVLNLARNAVEAMSGLPPSRRSLTISTSQSEAGKVRLAVADVGPGIAPAIRDRLFEPFQTTKPEGMGLGLVISRSIIEAHGGQLEWDAAATVGTTFSLTLPRSPTR